MTAIFKQEDMCPYCHRLLHHPWCTPERRAQLNGSALAHAVAGLMPALHGENGPDSRDAT